LCSSGVCCSCRCKLGPFDVLNHVAQLLAGADQQLLGVHALGGEYGIQLCVHLGALGHGLEEGIINRELFMKLRADSLI